MRSVLRHRCEYWKSFDGDDEMMMMKWKIKIFKPLHKTSDQAVFKPAFCCCSSYQKKVRGDLKNKSMKKCELNWANLILLVSKGFISFLVWVLHTFFDWLVEICSVY